MLTRDATFGGFQMKIAKENVILHAFVNHSNKEQSKIRLSEATCRDEVDRFIDEDLYPDFDLSPSPSLYMGSDIDDDDAENKDYNEDRSDDEKEEDMHANEKCCFTSDIEFRPKGILKSHSEPFEVESNGTGELDFKLITHSELIEIKKKKIVRFAEVISTIRIYEVDEVEDRRKFNEITFCFSSSETIPLQENAISILRDSLVQENKQDNELISPISQSESGQINFGTHDSYLSTTSEMNHGYGLHDWSFALDASPIDSMNQIYKNPISMFDTFF